MGIPCDLAGARNRHHYRGVWTMESDQIIALRKIAKAQHDLGDYLGAIATLRRLLREDLRLFEAETADFVASFSKRQKPRFWIPPPGLFPDLADLQTTFEFIYERAVWGGGSGGGSSLKNNALYIAYVQELMERHSVRSIIDVGCGDWSFSRYIDFGERDYVGLDIVPSVVLANSEKYGTKYVRFEHKDVCNGGPLPGCDLVICKDVLQHLRNQEVQKIIENCSRARLMLVTNDYDSANLENHVGGTRPLDVSRPPFNLSAWPVCRQEAKVTFLKA